MKKRISVLAALIVLALAVLAAPAAMADITMVQVTKAASVRSAPGFNSEKLELAEAGAQYIYLGEESGWYEVQLNGTTAGFLPRASCKLVTIAGIPTGSPQDAIANIASTLKAGKGFEKEIPEAFAGKTLIAACFDPELGADETSVQSAAAGARYREIPNNLLAARMDEADWALLVYAKATGAEDDPLDVYVFPVDVKNLTYYEPYNIKDRKTLLSDREKQTDISLALAGIKEEVLLPRWEKSVRLAGDENYQTGLKLMGEGKYFSASEAFRKSEAPEAAEMAGRCVQAWPETGEIWRNPAVKGSNMELTLKVNQDGDHAIYVKLFRSNVHAASLFIAGTGQVTLRLPAGAYVIRDGVGIQWYGETEAFGRYGVYETLTFGEKDQKQVKLQNGHAYTITLNPDDSNPDADDVGSEYEEWDSF